MNFIIDSESLDQTLSENPLVLVYFSGELCNVCHALKPKIEGIIQQNFPNVIIVEIPTEKAPVLVGRFRMFSVPAIVLFVEGREYLREVRNISTIDLAQKINKIISLYEAK